MNIWIDDYDDEMKARATMARARTTTAMTTLHCHPTVMLLFAKERSGSRVQQRPRRSKRRGGGERDGPFSSRPGQRSDYD